MNFIIPKGARKGQPIVFSDPEHFEIDLTSARSNPVDNFRFVKNKPD